MEHTATVGRRAAIYVRISKDRNGEGAGVARQEQDCRAKCDSLGLQVVQVFSDNDVSAYSGRRRPAYDAMVKAITEGEIDTVVVWDTDRLHRQPRELETYADLCIARQVATITVQSGDLDLSDDDGLMMARFHGAMNAREMAKKSKRQKRANLQRAQEGRHFGTRRCFGYEPDGLTIREAEAAAIREAYELVQSGGALREVARRWNAAGLRTPQKEQEWIGATAGKTLRTARLAGYRTYQGEIMRDADGQPVETEWPAIVPRDTWHAVQAILDNPERKTYTAHTSQLLLSGVAKCATCGANIQSGGARKGRSRYRCSLKGGHVYREAEPINEYVEGVVLRRLAEPDLLDLISPAQPTIDVAALRREAAEVHGRMEALAEAFADGDITIAQLKAGNARAAARLSELETAMPTDTSRSALASLITARDLLGAWQRLSLDARRGVIDALVTVRLVAPGTKENAYRWEYGMRKVNPDTVLIEWR